MIKSEIKPRELVKFGKDKKILILGDRLTGKTSLLYRYIEGSYEPQSTTVVTSFSSKVYKKEDIYYRIQFWDISGQDLNPQIMNIFSKDCDGAIILADCINKESLNNTILWKNNLMEKIQQNKKIPVVLVENKIDLLEEGSDNSSINLLEEFSSKNQFDKVFRTSAKEGTGVDDVFDYIINFIIEEGKKYEMTEGDNYYLESESGSENIKLLTLKDDDDEENKCKFCKSCSCQY